MSDKLTLKKTEGAWFINFALGIAGKAQLKKLNKAAKDCGKTSNATLRGILEYAKDSEWGKAHHFAEILSAEDDKTLYELWQKNVPPQDYEDLRPFVERHKTGEENILFPGKPMMYATTSGTTNQPKWIPITNEYYGNVYSKMTKLWLYSFMMHRPTVFDGRCISIVGKAVEGYAPDGTVYGSVSGVTRRDVPKFISKLHSAPYQIFNIEDYASRYYAIMRCGLEQNVGSIVTANPSTIKQMINNINEHFDEYVEDIEKGTLKADLDIPNDIRKEIEEYFQPNPVRALELKALKSKYKEILPKHYWPNMRVLTTWKCGNTRSYATRFADAFPPEMNHQEFGYFASECRAGLVINGQDDTVLFPHMHFFEFVAEDDLENPNPKFIQIQDVEVGKRYAIYVTTYAGLYRYNMNDLVEITGKYDTIPTIQFIQKINGIVSMTGEKIHESQFIDAVNTAIKETGKDVPFYLGFADLAISTYQWYFEFADENITPAEVERFAWVVENDLRKRNVEYEAKRSSFRINDPIVHSLKPGSLEQFKLACLDAGMGRDGQFKYNLLMQNEPRHNIIKTLVK